MSACAFLETHFKFIVSAFSLSLGWLHPCHGHFIGDERNVPTNHVSSKQITNSSTLGEFRSVTLTVSKVKSKIG